ncbi:MAG: hypothetical protein AAF430_21620 [Myxococcota bacterium]
MKSTRLRWPMLLLLAPWILGAPAAAVDWDVNSIGDGGDLDPLDGACDTGGTIAGPSGPEAECTLRAAIQQAGENDVIGFGSPALVPDANGQIRIVVSAALPALSQRGLIIGGGDAAGFDHSDPWARPVVVLDGSSLASGDGLRLSGPSQLIWHIGIVHFPDHGIVVDSEYSKVRGCHIGLEQGSMSAGNGDAGVLVSAGARFAQVGRQCSSLPVGSCSGRANVVSGNGSDGIRIEGSENVVAGNRVGVDASGSVAIPNGGFGVRVSGGFENQIGGSNGSNLVSANTLGGIRISGNSTLVWGNAVGLGADGSTPLPNAGPGIDMDGEDTTSFLDDVAFNQGPGVQVSDGTGNRVSRSILWANDGPEIDLGADGPTPNDPLDVDTGPNHRMNSPEPDPDETVYSSAEQKVRILYKVDTAATEAAFPITTEWFLDPLDERKTRLGVDVYPLSSLLLYRSVGYFPNNPVPVGTRIVGTATDADGNTSEMSAPIPLQAPGVALGTRVGFLMVCALAFWRRVRS